MLTKEVEVYVFMMGAEVWAKNVQQDTCEI